MGLIETNKNSHGRTKFLRIRSFLLVALLVISTVFQAALPQAVHAATATFQVSDYRSSGNIINTLMSVYWRGYLFSVTQDTTITNLVGGGGAGFQTAIYNVTSVTNGGNTVTPGAPIGHATNVSGAVNEVLTISGGNANGGTAIFLAAGTQYLLASGKTSSGSGNHWTVGDINVDNILLSPRIASWGPNVASPVGKTLYWSSPASQNQSYTYLQGVANNAVTGSTIPALGFKYTISDINSAEVTTLAPTFSNSGAKMNARIDSTGGGATTMAIIYGQTSNLSSGNTTEIIGTTEATPDGVVPFYFEKADLSAGLWYYRARGENDSGSTLGSILPFTVYNLSYGVTNDATCSTVSGLGGSITGTISQKAYSYDTDGDGGAPATYSSGSSVTATPSAGFGFVKWCDNASTNATRTDTALTGGSGVYAQFAPRITFNSQGGSSTDAITAFEGSEITLPNAPTRSGYTFSGWNSAVDGSGDSFTAGSNLEMTSVGFTLYATWTENEETEATNTASLVSPTTSKQVTVGLSDEACAFNEASMAAESANVVQDHNFAYMGGLVNFSANCSDPTVTVTLTYYGVPKDGLIVRKYDPRTQQYSTVETATISQSTVDGQVVTIATYDVTDGGHLDTDGEVNGTIVDPVGLATPIEDGLGAPNTGLARKNVALSIVLGVAGLVLIGLSIIGLLRRKNA